MIELAWLDRCFRARWVLVLGDTEPWSSGVFGAGRVRGLLWRKTGGGLFGQDRDFLVGDFIDVLVAFPL